MSMRHWMSLCESADVKKIIAYHGSQDTKPFDHFDPSKINSKTGNAYGAFFFAARRETAETYLQTDEVLKPEAQKKYDSYSSEYQERRDALTTQANIILRDHGLSPIKEFNLLSLEVLTHKQNDPDFTRAMSALMNSQMSREASSYLRLACDIYDRERNFTTVSHGIIYRCEITLHHPFERDMEGVVYTKDKWRDVFSIAVQSANIDGVILYNTMDSAADFGMLDTVYAVFNPASIHILDYEIYK